MPFATGANIGPYRILSQLGQGGMATVFKAYHAALDRYVAIKVLHAAFQEDPDFLARFQREARVVAKLEHPNIVPVHDYSEHDGQPYLVMRFIDGETLKARLARGPVSAQETLRIVEAVGDGLSHAHRQGILHRDIKPSNILLGADDGVYLADFGLARIAQAGESTLSSDMLMGTPQYISPEQARGERTLDERTDVYSFGVVLYELMVGRVPFSADTPFSIIHDHIYTPLPLPRSINPQVAEAVERVLLKALAKERHDRYQSVDEMVVAFRRALEAEPPPPTTARIPERGPAEPASQIAFEPPAPVQAAQAVQRIEAQHARYRTVGIAALAVACVCLAGLAPVAVSRIRLWRQASATPLAATATRLPSAATPSPDDLSPDQALSMPVAGTDLPQECGLSQAAYGDLGVGALVVLGRHRPVEGDDFWSEEMDRYIGRQALVTALAGIDRTGCPGVRVDEDGGSWFWRIRDLVLVSPPPAEGSAGLPQRCGLSEAEADYGPIAVGTAVLLGRHRPVNGDDFWSAGMEGFVGRQAVVTALAGVDRAGCPGVRVDADAGSWFWRLRDLVPLS